MTRLSTIWYNWTHEDGEEIIIAVIDAVGKENLKIIGSSLSGACSFISHLAKSTLTRPKLPLDNEVNSSNPETVDKLSSRYLTTSLSTSKAIAPRYGTITEITGSSIVGKKSIGSLGNYPNQNNS